MTPEKIAMKRATQDMIRGVGGVEDSAKFCRVGKSVLSDYGSPNKPDCFAPLDVVADLEPLARARDGWPHVTRALCTAMGGVFVAIPENDVTPRDLLALLGDKARESGELTAAICNALVDGKIDRIDGAAITLEIDQLIAVAAAMRATVQSLVRGDQ